MTQKLTTAAKKTPATKKVAKKVTAQKVVKTKAENQIAPRVPRPEEIPDKDWMNWVEYAQAKLRYLENKVASLTEELAAQKASNKRLNDRFMQG